MGASVGGQASLAHGGKLDKLDGFLSQDDWYQQFMQLKQQHEQLIH
jgi:hypothetical protein